jgi:hypothetical protein
MPLPEPGLIRVRTLLCHRDVALMIACWRTLVQCSAEQFETVVHDDGSLTAADEAAIGAAIPRSRVLRRAEADARMAEHLARHENARTFRAGSVWGLKLLDVVLAEGGDCYYVDGDIRFFRPFRGLFCRAALAGRGVFLRDTEWIAYSVRPWHLMDRRRLRVVEGINTGLVLHDRAEFDLDFVDWFLGQPDWRVIPAWTEPTCWAALGARHDGHAIDPAQVKNLYPNARVTDATIGAHFLSAYRGRFQQELAAMPRLSESVEEIRFLRLGEAGPLALGGNQLKRKLSNEWSRRRPRT